MKNQRNTLESKYLTAPKGWEQPRNGGTECVNTETLGNMGLGHVAVGVYYCSKTDEFRVLEYGIVDPLVDPRGVPWGVTWRLVTEKYVHWMEETVRKAFSDPHVSSDDLSDAIMKFYRVRDRLEQDMDEAWPADAAG